MGACRCRISWSSWILAAAVSATCFIYLGQSNSTTYAAASGQIPTCSFGQLEVAVAWGPGAAAGNLGIPFLIANRSKSTCSLEGYPIIQFNPHSYKGTSVKTVHHGGMIYAAVHPHLVVIKPASTASFGINYGDASNPQDPYGTPCRVRSAFVTLPVRNRTLHQIFETAVSFNFCYTNFLVSVTALQAGPVPKAG
ncbi:MAG: DUF4232 domain-containing protein [Acidimicrobiales bacterium]